MFLCLAPSLLCAPAVRAQTDKASMLDEAIEYLKMLQLQLQVRSCPTPCSSPLPNSMLLGMARLY